MSARADRRNLPLLANLLLFGRILRHAGLPVSHSQTLDFARALTLVDIGNRDQVKSAARCFLVSRREEMELFESLFDRFWRRHAADRDQARGERLKPRHETRALERHRRAGLLTARAGSADVEIELPGRARTYSAEEVFRNKDFSRMSPEELEELKRLILGLRWRASLRRTRRWTLDPSGSRVDLRRMLREAAKHAGAPVRLARRSRKSKRRPIVLLADVSGSMERYSRIVLQFFYGALHGLGTAGVECFVFGTRLTRITAALKNRNVDRALEDAAGEIPDWSGGTRIGESLGTFNRQWSRRVLGRGAIVVVVSDGWERGDVTALRREMRYLHHRCHRLIWLNPHAGQSGYEPLVEGIVNALPFVDDFLPIHNLDSLSGLTDVLTSLPSRKKPPRPGRARVS